MDQSTHFPLNSHTALKMEFFNTAIKNYSTNILTLIAADYGLPLDELLEKYKDFSPKKPKKVTAEPKEDRPMCPVLTDKNAPCKNKCMPGGEACRMHSAVLPGGIPKPPKTPKVPKVPKKVIPIHNHKPLVEPTEPCTLCETHGDAFDPNLARQTFAAAVDLKDRLRMILASGSDV